MDQGNGRDAATQEKSMKSKRKPKFILGQWVKCGDHYGQIEGTELQDVWYYIVSCCPFARLREELRPLTQREVGPGWWRRKP